MMAIRYFDGRRFFLIYQTPFGEWAKAAAQSLREEGYYARVKRPPRRSFRDWKVYRSDRKRDDYD